MLDLLVSRWTERHGPVYDIVTPTPTQRAREAMLARHRRQLRVTLVSVALLMLGLVVPAPTGVRLVLVMTGALAPPAVALVMLGRRGR